MIELERLGTSYGGWVIPKDLNLSSESVVYSAGVGEDISFDLLISEKYDSNIFLIDPTHRAKVHYDEIFLYFYAGDWKFSGDIQQDYHKIIGKLNPNIEKIKYIDLGLWDKKDVLKFYKQDNTESVSQSFIDNMFGSQFDEVNVDSIKNIMELNDHKNIDLLKLDIEGAEIKVLDKMLDDNIYPKYLCIEFDLYLKGVDTNDGTKRIAQRLNDCGYEVLFDEQLNVTFSRK